MYCFNSSTDNPAPFKCSKNFSQLASSSLYMRKLFLSRSGVIKPSFS
ncbi:MerR family transcriptional regulator [Listeria monocytogenes]|nr:MerR family transcriptional regulator [Listeria monocytogenes]GAT38215.1 MerR family transcriptional regulator [Listeria monocytogenes]GAT41062.1 MerR family transcriptional regulator [Listeria monocytogenes]